DLRPLAADDDARTRRVDVDLQLVGGALRLDLRDAGVREPLLERLPQVDVLVQQLRVVSIGVPARAPRLVEPEPESDRVNLLAHKCSFYALAFSARLAAADFFTAPARGRRFVSPSAPTATTF